MFIQNYDRISADRSWSGGGFAYIDPINYLNRNDLVGDNLEAICIEVFKPSSASSLLEPFIGPYLTSFQILNNGTFPY